MATVLVVDDDPDVLDTLAAILRSAEHVVLKAGSGIAALDLLDQGCAPHLMITDVIMPGLNGFNLARMARMRRAGMKILYLTGFHERVIALRDAGERFGKLLTKPIEPAELRAEVSAVLGAAA